MKRFKFAVAGAVLSVLMLTNTAVLASENFNFNPGERKISVNMEIGIPQKSFADVLIMKSNDERDAIVAENIDFDSFLYKKAHTLGGRVSQSIKLSDSFKAGEYIMYVECGEYQNCAVFILPSQKLGEATKLANANKDFSLIAFGADMGSLNENKTEIDKLIKNLRNQGEFTDESFLKGYIQASGIARLMNGKLSLEEFCDLYESYFEYDLGMLVQLKEEDKEKFLEAVKGYEIGNVIPEKFFEGAEFVTECKAASEQYTLLEIVEKYINSNGSSFGDYNSLNSYYKKAAGSALKSVIAQLNSAEEIYNKFIEIAKDEYAKQNKPSNNGSSGGGGGGGGATGLYTPGINNALTQKPEEDIKETASVFSDIKGHWGEKYITECFNKGIIKGYNDNSFRPEASISRAETAALIQRVFRIADGESNEFVDINDNAWYRGCVLGLSDARIIEGHNGYFRPADNISREEMSVILYRALAYCEIKPEGEMAFSDDEAISDYAKESVSCLAANGIITGEGGMFRPSDKLTRAEAATLIYRTVNVFLGGEL